LGKCGVVGAIRRIGVKEPAHDPTLMNQKHARHLSAVSFQGPGTMTGEK
jgi:hypothetical protein